MEASRARYSVVRPFDPWRRGSLCTCPFKYTVNPYTGCSHSCLYCYASSYVKDFFSPRGKDRFLEHVSRDLKRIPRGSIINVSSSSDPYIPMERENMLTRRLLERIVGDYAVEIVTKSDLVTRDVDLLSRGKSVVSITITTLDEELAGMLEPAAPSPTKRVNAVRRLSERGLPVVVRLDPLIPFLTDGDENIRSVVEAVAEAGAKHIISSTYKVKLDNLSRVIAKFPSLSKKLSELYFERGERVHGAHYAPKGYRERVLLKVREKAKSEGLTFSVCREGLTHLNDENVACDGTSLMRGTDFGAQTGKSRSSENSPTLFSS